MSPRVLLASTSLRAGNGGIARVARLTARTVAATSAHIDSLSLLDDTPTVDLGVNVRVAHSSRLRFVAEIYRATASYNRFIYDFAGIGRAHPRVAPLRRPFAVWMHGIEVWEEARRNRLDVLRSADLVLCNSAHTLERAERLHGAMPNVRICWLSTEDDVAPSQRERRGPPTVMIVARLDESRYKGHTALLDAWPRVVAAVPDARLVVVGAGPSLSWFRDLARVSTVGTHIDVRGFVPDEQMPELWSAATVFAMPSRGEGFGLVYIEAMRHRVPVIASIHDAGCEINIDGVTGYNIDLDRGAELEDRLVHLLRDDALARELGRNGHARWKDHFMMSAFRRRFLEATQDFLA